MRKKKVLKGKRCYLSGPIENDQTGHNWRDHPREFLVRDFKIDLFDPFADPKQQWVGPLMEAKGRLEFDEMARIAKMFVRKDLAMVDRADFVVAYLPKGIPTTGTHHEIINSANAKKPTLLVCPQGKEHVPLWYYGFIPHEFMFDGWDYLHQYLTEVDEWKHSNNDRWAFVYGLV